MPNLVKYGVWTPDAVTAEEKELEKSGGGDFLKLVLGKNVLRFLPPKLGQSTPFIIVWQHYIKKPGASGNISFACPRAHLKAACPVCDHADALGKTGSPADREAAYQLRAKIRVFANVIERGEGGAEKGPQILAYGKKVHEQLLQLRKDVDAGGDFTDPINGFDITIERTGTGKDDTTYAVRPARNNTPLGNMDWIDAQADLGRYAVPKTAAEIQELLGIDPDPQPTDVNPRRAALAAGAPPARAAAAAGQTVRASRTVADDLSGEPLEPS